MSAVISDERQDTMGKKRQYVIRIVQTQTPECVDLNEGGDISAFVECLRYAGIVRVHEVSELTTLCFDLVCPAHFTDSQRWAERNAERMRTFGFNAVAAPATEEP